MVQKFKKLLGVTYCFTQSYGLIPQKLLTQINLKTVIDWNTERFFAICWTQKNTFPSILSSSFPFSLFNTNSFQYVMITDKRIIVQRALFQQNLFSDITGIEENLYHDIIVTSASNPTSLFGMVRRVPKTELVNIIFQILNQQWINTKTNKGITDANQNAVNPTSDSSQVFINTPANNPIPTNPSFLSKVPVLNKLSKKQLLNLLIGYIVVVIVITLFSKKETKNEGNNEAGTTENVQSESKETGETFLHVEDGKAVANEDRASENSVAQQKEDYEKRKAEFEEKCLSGWDGSNRELVRIVKENMNDPDSFEHVETLYRLYKDYAVVIMKFRGNNTFGGKVLNSVTAKVNIEDGSVISVQE